MQRSAHLLEIYGKVTIISSSVLFIRQQNIVGDSPYIYRLFDICLFH